MQEDASALAGGAHEAAEGLVNFGHAGNLVDAAKCGFPSELGVFREAGALDGVNLGERWAYDHGVAHAAAEQIDAFGKTGAEDQKQRIGEREGFLDPGGLSGEVGEAWLERDAEAGVRAGEFAR